MSRPLFAFVLSLHCLLVSAQTTLSLSLKDTYASGAFASVAEVSDVNVVVIGDPQQRLTAEATGSDPNALLAALAKAAGLTHREVEGVQIVSPKACELQELTSPPPLSDEPISIHLQTVSPSWLLALLADSHKLRRSNRDTDPKKPVRLITVHLKRVPASTIYQLISTITGARLTLLADGSYRVDEPPRTVCGSVPTPTTAGTNVEEPQVLGTGDTCPRREQDRRRGIRPLSSCAELEKFAVEDLVVRGTITRLGRVTPLIETPDGLTYPVRLGDYLGYHYGRITGIDSAGLVIREVKLDSMNVYREHRTHIDWSNERRSLQDEAP